MNEIKIPKQKLHEVVDQILKKKDFKYAKVYAMYHPRYGVRIKYFGANYNKEALPFLEGVQYLDITSCFDTHIKMLIVSSIIEKLDAWLVKENIKVG